VLAKTYINPDPLPFNMIAVVKIEDTCEAESPAHSSPLPPPTMEQTMEDPPTSFAISAPAQHVPQHQGQQHQGQLMMSYVQFNNGNGGTAAIPIMFAQNGMADAMPILMVPTTNFAMAGQPFAPAVQYNSAEQAQLVQKQLMYAKMMSQHAQMAELRNPQGESKQCNCKKSRCLKLYCDCFAANVFCKNCKCKDCQNVPEHNDVRMRAIEHKLARRPGAFDPKVNPMSMPSMPSMMMPAAPADERHSMGCNCKKSGCAKKYCECYQNGVACSSICRCEGCQNDGSLLHLRTFGVAEPQLIPIPGPALSQSSTGSESSSIGSAVPPATNAFGLMAAALNFMPCQANQQPPQLVPDTIGIEDNVQQAITIDTKCTPKRQHGTFGMHPIESSNRKRLKKCRMPSEESLDNSSDTCSYDTSSDSAHSGSSEDPMSFSMDELTGTVLDVDEPFPFGVPLNSGFPPAEDARFEEMPVDIASSEMADLIDLKTDPTHVYTVPIAEDDMMCFLNATAFEDITA